MTAPRATPDTSTTRASRGLRERLEDWEIRRPVTATLRLHEVVVWVVVSSAFALLFAPLAIGKDIKSFELPTSYMRVWVVLCSAFAVRWVYLQWRDRPSLPRHSRLPWGWSSAISSLIAAAILVPSIVAGQAAESRIRALRSASAVAEDMARLSAFTGGRWLTKAAPSHYYSTWEHAATSKGGSSSNPSRHAAPWEMLELYVPHTLVEEARACSESFFRSEQYSERRAHCGESISAEKAALLRKAG